MWWGKLNQWKIWKTEPTENLHQPSHTFKCRKVSPHNCPCINVLSLGTSSYLECWNWTKKLKNGHHFVKYQLYGNISNYQPPPQSLGLQFSECQQKWNISVGHYEKIEKWPPFYKYLLYRNISNYQTPKVWVSGFPCINKNRISVSAIMKNWKNGHHFENINCTEIFHITNPPKVWVFGFLSVNRNGLSVLAIMKKSKNGCHL